MRLLVVSHKPCWFSESSPTGVVACGGFPLQMRTISELFDETTVAVPVDRDSSGRGGMALLGRNLRVLPLTPRRGRGVVRKLAMPLWFAGNARRLLRAIRRADAVHAPIPSDVGTIGMLLASMARKPLFVRHCGNWLVTRTAAERFWRWYMERFAGGRNVMFATGGGERPPSPKNGAIRWIFSSSLSRSQMRGPSPRPFDPAAPRLITVSRLEPHKGTDRILAALPLLLRRFRKLSLDVVGGGSLLRALRLQARELGVDDAVVFHGHVGHGRVLALLSRADLFCYPTAASEGFPKVVLEALAAGLPVVTTPVSVLPHLMAGGGGLILDDADPASVADGVARCLKRHASMSRDARRTAGRYTLEEWKSEIGRELSAAWGPLRAG